MTDPLAGQRRAINARTARILTWPHDAGCPVKVGDRFKLASCEVEITRVKESIKPGRDPLWVAEFTRHEQERTYFLRAAPPAHADGEEDTRLDAASIKKAGVESAYTSSPVAAIQNEPESVGPDWEDKGMAERELRRQEERKARMTTERAEAEVDKAAARLKQVGRTLGRNGRDLTPLLDEIYERLAREEREAA